MDLGVYILFYEKAEQTIECLRSCLQDTVNIYILNNNSSEKSSSVLHEFCRPYKNIKIFKSEENLGVARGRNFLISNTSENWLLFLDNDVRISTKDWYPKFEECLQGSDKYEAYIPRLFNLHENSWVVLPNLYVDQNRKFVLKERSSPKVNHFPGGASFVSRKVFERLGLYDEKIFVGSEDVELALRGILSGAPVEAKTLDGIELIHEHRVASCAEEILAARQRYDLKSIASSYNLIFKKHAIWSDDSGWKVWATEQYGHITGRKFHFFIHKTIKKLRESLRKLLIT